MKSEDIAFYLFVLVFMGSVVLLVLKVMKQAEQAEYQKAFEVQPLTVSGTVKEDKVSDTPFPRLLWFFWDGEPNAFVLQCLKSWRRFARGWEIRGVNFDNLYSYLDASDLPRNFDNLDCIQRKTDCVRLALLYKYGGVWSDATVMLNRDLDEWVTTPLENGSFFHSTLKGFLVKRWVKR